MSTRAGDRTYIRDLTARCIIGLNDWEREKRQDVTINLELWTDHRKAAATDDLAHALDYRSLKKDVLASVETSSHRLVEALAENIAATCLKHDGVERVIVTLDKPGALRFARSVAVQVDRETS